MLCGGSLKKTPDPFSIRYQFTDPRGTNGNEVN
jgi:hypothetical protein